MYVLTTETLYRQDVEASGVQFVIVIIIIIIKDVPILNKGGLVKIEVQYSFKHRCLTELDGDSTSIATCFHRHAIQFCSQQRQTIYLSFIPDYY